MPTVVEAEVKVNLKQAQKEFDNFSESIQLQEEYIAGLKVKIAEYEASLRDLSVTQRQLRESSIKKMNEELKVESATLRQLKVQQQGLNKVLKSTNKTRTVGTIKAAQFNETLLKNEDVTSGLSTLTGGYASQVKNLGRLFISASKGLKIFIAGLTLTKKALIATGIGAFVVLLGTLIANFEKIKSLFTGVSTQQKDLLESQQKSAQASKEQLESISETENILKLQGKTEKEILTLKQAATEELITQLEAQLETQKSIRKSQIETAEKNKEILMGILQFITLPLAALLEGVDAALGLLGKESNLREGLYGGIAGLVFNPEKVKEEGDKTIDETEKRLTQLKNQRAGYELSINKINKDADDKRLKEQQEAYDKELKALQDRLNKEIDMRVAADTKVGNIRRDFFLKNLGESEQADAIRLEYEREKLVKEIEESTANAAAKRMAIAEVNKFYDEQQTRNTQDWNAKRVKTEIDTEQEILDNKLAAIDATEKLEAEKINLLAGFGNFLGQLGEQNKGIQIASVIVSQAAAIAKIVSNTAAANARALLELGPIAGAAAGVRNNIAAGISIASSIAAGAQAIQQIKSVKADATATQSAGATGGGGATPSAPPAFNVVGASGANQLATAIAGQQGQPVKAFVVSGDVSTAQELDRNIVQGAAIG
jgi:hypothetical protein